MNERKPMTYIRVRWLHDCPDEPIWLFSELDDLRCEVRKVEVFADGSQGFASSLESVGSTQLGEAPVPPLSEIAAEPEFEPEEISKEEFEAVWAARSGARPA
jgi:hypothetical protein